MAAFIKIILICSLLQDHEAPLSWTTSHRLMVINSATRLATNGEAHRPSPRDNFECPPLLFHEIKRGFSDAGMIMKKMVEGGGSGSSISSGGRGILHLLLLTEG